MKYFFTFLLISIVYLTVSLIVPEKVDAIENDSHPKVIVNSDLKEKNRIEKLNLKSDRKGQSPKRISIDNSSKRIDKQQEEFEQKINEPLPIFKTSASLNETINEITELTGLNIRLITSATEGYSFDKNYKPLNKTYFHSKLFNFDFENMPIKEIFRYVAISGGLEYRIDLENQEMVLADPGVILDQNFTEITISESSIEGVLGEEINSKSEQLEDFKRHLKKFGVPLPAGSKVFIQNGKLELSIPERYQKRVVVILKEMGIIDP